MCCNYSCQTSWKYICKVLRYFLFNFCGLNYRPWNFRIEILSFFLRGASRYPLSTSWYILIYVIFICYLTNYWYLSKNVTWYIIEENVLRINLLAYDCVQQLGQSLVNIKNGAVTGHRISRNFEWIITTH